MMAVYYMWQVPGGKVHLEKWYIDPIMGEEKIYPRFIFLCGRSRSPNDNACGKLHPSLELDSSFCRTCVNAYRKEEASNEPDDLLDD